MDLETKSDEELLALMREALEVLAGRGKLADAKQADANRPLTTKHAADLIGIAARTLYNWRGRGYGPRWRNAGRLIVYDLHEVERWNKEQTTDRIDTMIIREKRPLVLENQLQQNGRHKIGNRMRGHAVIRNGRKVPANVRSPR